MRILIAHNFYRSSTGGEDVVFVAEREMLRASGHEVIEYTVSNREIHQRGLRRVALGAVWNQRAYREVFEMVSRHHVEVAHFHNTQPLLSPAVYYAARRAGAAVVQTLHNYRLLCPRADLCRDGTVCEDCVKHWVPWAGIWRGCYRSSRAATVVAGSTVSFHRAVGTWARAVDMYVAMTPFAQRKFAAWGIPQSRLAIKPNFLFPDPGPGEGRGGYALYAGRLSVEKGIPALLAAYSHPAPPIPLKIIGSGPLEAQVKSVAGSSSSVEWIGWQPRDKVLELMRRASVVVVPSTCYESFPMTIVEAFASGVPVLASRTDGIASILSHGCTGILTAPGDVGELRAQLAWVAGHPAELRRMGAQARREFEAKYTAERNYSALMEIYERAIAGRGVAVEPQAAAAQAAGHAG